MINPYNTAPGFHKTAKAGFDVWYQSIWPHRPRRSNRCQTQTCRYLRDISIKLQILIFLMRQAHCDVPQIDLGPGAMHFEADPHFTTALLKHRRKQVERPAIEALSNTGHRIKNLTDTLSGLFGPDKI